MPERLAIECLRAGIDASDPAFAERAREAELEGADTTRAAVLLDTAWRRLGTLRALVQDVAYRHPKPDVAACLHVALAEFFFVADGDDERALHAAVQTAADQLDLARARFVDAVARRALELRLPGHVGDPRRDLVDAPWHTDRPVLRDPAPHRYLWAEDAVAMPAPLVKRWSERYGWDAALAVARAALRAPEGDGRAPWLAGATEGEGLVCEPASTETADLAARPAARWRFGPKSLAAHVRAQSAALLAAAESVGGAPLVFATRSLEPAENAGAVRALLRARDDLELVRDHEHRPAPGTERGGYVAVIAGRR